MTNEQVKYLVGSIQALVYWSFGVYFLMNGNAIVMGTMLLLTSVFLTIFSRLK